MPIVGRRPIGSLMMQPGGVNTPVKRSGEAKSRGRAIETHSPTRSVLGATWVIRTPTTAGRDSIPYHRGTTSRRRALRRTGSQYTQRAVGRTSAPTRTWIRLEGTIEVPPWWMRCIRFAPCPGVVLESAAASDSSVSLFPLSSSHARGAGYRAQSRPGIGSTNV